MAKNRPAIAASSYAGPLAATRATVCTEEKPRQEAVAPILAGVREKAADIAGMRVLRAQQRIIDSVLQLLGVLRFAGETQ
jgi:hypothetical protein